MAHIDNYSLRVASRHTSQLSNGLRPFQAKTLKAIADPSKRLILVEAPVGSGKSHIIRTLFEQEHSKPIVLTYPTRILLQAQLDDLKSEIPDLRVLPGDRIVDNAPALVEYSGATLLKMAQKGDWDQWENRSDLLISLFKRLELHPEPRLVMTPDVLHLIVNKEFYKRSRYLQRRLKGGIFVFDEFHLYHDLQHFYNLVTKLKSHLRGQVVLLSATPVGVEKLEQDVGSLYRIGFEGCPADAEGAHCFNHDIDLHVIDSFDTSDIVGEARLILETLQDCPKPAAVILDSVFRLRHILRKVRHELEDSNLNVYEWSGERKQKADHLDSKSVLFGTAAIEVGVDEDFRTLIMEASQWASAVQRLGRVARKNPGIVYFITRQRIDYLVDSTVQISRKNLEHDVLRKAFKYNKCSEDKLAASDASEMFRGDNFSFALHDTDIGDTFFGDEALFARYDILDQGCDNWRALSVSDKEKQLQQQGLPDSQRSEVLLRDSVFPFWGVVTGRLANNYTRVSTRYRPLHKSLTVSAKKPYVYYAE